MTLEGLGEVIRAAANGAVSSTCEQVREQAQLLCPVDTGNLRGSIGTVVEAAEDGAAGAVTATAVYSSVVELGTSRQAARPFLLPAFTAAKEGLAGEIAKRITG